MNVDVMAPAKISQYFTQEMKSVIKSSVKKTLEINKFVVINLSSYQQSNKDGLLPIYPNFFKNPIS
jgi:hypothetical protein